MPIIESWLVLMRLFLVKDMALKLCPTVFLRICALVSLRRFPDKLHCRFLKMCLFKTATMLNRPISYLSLNILCVALGCVATVLGAKASEGTCRAERGGKPFRALDFMSCKEGPGFFPVCFLLDINRTTDRCLRMRKVRFKLLRSIA